MDTGNFHVFFAGGCYRKKPTQRRNQIFGALDALIEKTNFDMGLFAQKKEVYLSSIGTEQEKEAFKKLNELITPLFLHMKQEGFSTQELQNYEGL